MKFAVVSKEVVFTVNVKFEVVSKEVVFTVNVKFEVVSKEVVFTVCVYGVVSTVWLSVLCNSIVNVIAGIVVLMLEDVAVVCTIAVVFCSVTWLVVNVTVDESLWPLFVNECVVVILAVVPPVTVGEFGVPVDGVMVEIPNVVSLCSMLLQEKIQKRLYYNKCIIITCIM